MHSCSTRSIQLLYMRITLAEFAFSAGRVAAPAHNARRRSAPCLTKPVASFGFMLKLLSFQKGNA